MSVLKAEISMTSWKGLSEAIRNELADMDKVPVRGGCIFVKSPKSIKELEASPNWAEFCREEDVKPGERVLINYGIQ